MPKSVTWGGEALRWCLFLVKVVGFCWVGFPDFGSFVGCLVVVFFLKYLFWPYLLNNLLGVISYFVGFRGGKLRCFLCLAGFPYVVFFVCLLY